MKIILAVMLVSLFGFGYTNENAKTGSEWANSSKGLAHDTLPDTLNVWIYFRDKGAIESQRPYPRSVVSPRSLDRRRRILPESALIDATDLPVNQSYIRAVQPLVIRVRHRSRWFNGISVQVLKSNLERIIALPFVRNIDTARRYGIPANANYSRTTTNSVTGDSSLYGPSWTQLRQINVPALHTEGNCGQGVLIGVFDDGFNSLNHDVFRNMRVVATYDFAENKANVMPSDFEVGGGDHGTATLSTIGGYSPGQLIGPAYCASYLLARTETVSSETPLEEDNWVAAIEWADSIGVDIVSTSLNYQIFDSPYRSGNWTEMDGNTSLITRAADMAASKGILVFVAGGNTGHLSANLSHNSLWAPADGDSVVSVGAVNATGERVSSSYWGSSFGPTTGENPRIKPDLMALGENVVVASLHNQYMRSDGTSFACPLAAGAAALILRDVPGATPMEIIVALSATASNGEHPNSLGGWGIINARAARDYLRRLRSRN